MSQPIKNIIFDLGGVLLDIDYQLTIQAFQKLGIENFDTIYSQAQQTSVFDDLETRKISPETFCNEIRRIANPNFTDEQITSAWNAMLLHFPEERIAFLRGLKSKYRTFLLSNTNAIHLEAFSEIIMDKNGLPSLDELFEKVYFSHQVGMRKPNPEIFTYVCNANGLLPEETFFIDDSIQHVKGAEEAGLQTAFLDTASTNVLKFLPAFLRS